MHYTRGISDHSPVGVTVLGSSQVYLDPQLDPWYLRDKAFADRMKDEDCSDLLRDIQLLVLSEMERGDLEAELTEEEVA
ncbi:hypothetical protein NDU88_003667 [Pleurodeles waltl]|uniref:Uncharacterized protein n=1 Tax=Pleurodeles waltl TaxID=8319 RepID=A0AAV7WTN9_PLEWA|nr:hypothetical protein NDU88_003667 [Pleurodeles waltl]